MNSLVAPGEFKVEILGQSLDGAFTCDYKLQSTLVDNCQMSLHFCVIHPRECAESFKIKSIH